jgi:hypothetical protein
MFKIKFSTDNAAFQDGNRNSETWRILREIADKLANGDESGYVRDVNGNSIGKWELS